MPSHETNQGRGVAFARRVFTVAAVYGIVVLGPQYFMEERLGREYPPPITHPEHFYGFIGLALVWQAMFLLIARDPIRFRPAMLVGILEKLAFGVPAIVLHTQGRLAGVVLAAGLLDMSLGVLFAVSYHVTRPRELTAERLTSSASSRSASGRRSPP